MLETAVRSDRVRDPAKGRVGGPARTNPLPLARGPPAGAEVKKPAGDANPFRALTRIETTIKDVRTDLAEAVTGAGHRLSAQQIIILGGMEDGWTASEIQSRGGSALTNLSHNVNKLIEGGYLSGVPAPMDRRVITLQRTELGHAIAALAAAPLVDLLRAHELLPAAPPAPPRKRRAS